MRRRDFLGNFPFIKLVDNCCQQNDHIDENKMMPFMKRMEIVISTGEHMKNIQKKI
jgi:hypothetical protein